MFPSIEENFGEVEKIVMALLLQSFMSNKPGFVANKIEITGSQVEDEVIHIADGAPLHYQ